MVRVKVGLELVGSGLGLGLVLGLGLWLGLRFNYRTFRIFLLELFTAKT